MNCSSRSGLLYSSSNIGCPVCLISFCGLAGPEALGQVAPERIEPRVGHLEESAHELWAVAIEERRGLRRVPIASLGSVAVALEKAQRHQRVEKIGIRSRVQPEGRAAVRRPVIARLPSSVNTPSSTAESRTFAGQKPMPISMMRAGDSELIGAFLCYQV